MIMGSFKTKGNILLLQHLPCPECHTHLVLWQDPCAHHAPFFSFLSPECTHQNHLLGFGRGLAVPGEVWEDCVLDDATRSLFGSGMSQRCVENPLMRQPQDFWTLSSGLLAGVCGHWSIPWSSAIKHLVKVILKIKSVSHRPSWFSPFSKGKSFFTFCFWTEHCSIDSSLSLCLLSQGNVSFSREFFHWSSQTETHSMNPSKANLSPSLWLSVAGCRTPSQGVCWKQMFLGLTEQEKFWQCCYIYRTCKDRTWV